MNLQALTEEEKAYYARQITMKGFGEESQTQLKNSKACITGLGGLGSPIATQLAAMGIGYLRIIDHDTVDITNLHRQHLYSIDSVGEPKTDAATERLRKLNPYIKIEPINTEITTENADKLVKDIDIVVDALDAMAPRYAVNKACVDQNIPFIHGGVIREIGTATTIIPHKTPCLECFKGGIDDSKLPSNASQGVHPSIINIIASIQTSETIKILTGKQPLLAGKLLFFDLTDLTMEFIGITKQDNCRICG
ncbi:MAG: HesA/MoeB/ThiF family protein [Candidatus Bathyarchaeota archaeon]|nr:HesA/MoeB/ThiF family protein [Candidatus Bathyarchaeota archaeon]